MEKSLVEAVAQAIYHHEGGMTDEDYLAATGKARLLWETDAPWDSNPEELCEHERDEYRIMAEAAIRAMMSFGVSDLQGSTRN